MKKLIVACLFVLSSVSFCFASYPSFYKVVKNKSFKELFVPDISKEKQSLTISVTTIANSGIDYVSSIPSTFKLYIPEGTIAGYINLYLPINNDTGYVARFKHQPLATFISSPLNKIPWSVPTSIKLDSLEKKDIYFKNRGGIVQILPSFALNSAMKKGGWLYIKKVNSGSPTIHRVTASFTVQTDIYKNWYSANELPGDAPIAETTTEAPSHSSNTSETSSSSINIADLFNLNKKSSKYFIIIDDKYVELNLDKFNPYIQIEEKVLPITYADDGCVITVSLSNDGTVLRFCKYNENLLLIQKNSIILINKQ